MMHLGDITKINGYNVPIADCVTFGAPCQDLSVAGKRKGMKHEDMGDEETTRSGLFHDAIRIIKEMREYDERINGRSGELIRPRYAVYENVPGAFSSNRGKDFRIVLEELAKIIDKDAVIPMPPKDKWSTSGCIVGDGWSIAWRVLDAQFWGVPQRRRRIALVADFGGQCAQEILFVSNRLQGDSEESRTERKRTSPTAEGCLGVYDRTRGEIFSFEPGIASREGGHIYEDVSGTLRANAGDNQMSVAYSINHQGGNVEQIIEDKTGTLTASMNSSGNNKLSVAYCYDIGDRRRIPSEYTDISPTLLGQMGTGGNNVPVVIEGLDVYNQSLTGDKTMTLTCRATDSHHIPCVVMDRSAFNQGINAKYDIGIDENGVAFSHIAKGPRAVCYALQGNQVDHADTSVCNGSGYKEDICYTLNTMDRHAIAYCIVNLPVPDAVCPDKELCKTLNCMDDPMKVAIVYNGANITSPLNITSPQIGDACHTLTPDSRNYLVETKPHYIVRRLTPLECERLQGFPDGWTDIGEYTDSKGKVRKTSDSARYKALGNSIALPPWKWVIKRLCSHYERDATMVSLFDGIGGFPLIWEQINGKGSCLWASEIEDFPMAVTTKRIGGVADD